MMHSQKQTGMTTIRVSERFRIRLGKIRATLTLEDGKEYSMEELLELMADAFERERKQKGKK
jgi:hypothetical protein